MDKVLIEKINNYFTDRIEEIKEGTYIPSYDKIKDLPEFSGISQAEFIVSRNEWYKQTFHTNSNEYSSRLAKIEGHSEEGSTIVITLIVIIGLIVAITIFVVGLSMIITYSYYSPQYQMRRGLLLLLISGITIFVVIIGLIQRGSVKEKKMEKKVTSMSQSDLINIFDCPSSGNKGAVFLIKFVKNFILVKQSCPTLHPYGWTNKVRVFRIPLRLKDHCVSYFRDTVFRCFKCGHEATVDYVRFSGPWALIRLSCPTHGNTRPYHKIYSTIYSEISNEGITIPQQIKSQPIPSEEKRFCRNCGERFKDAYQKVCQNCGLERSI